MWTPSISRPTRSRASSDAVCHAVNLRRRLGHEATTHRALAGAAALHRRRYRLQAPRVAPSGDAHQHLLDDPAIQRIDIGHGLERRQRDLVAIGAHARPLHGDLATAEDDFTADGAGPRGTALVQMRIPRPAEGGRDPLRASFPTPSDPTGPRAQTARCAYRRGDRPAADGGGLNNGGTSDCARLLHGGSLLAGFRPGLVTTRLPRAVRSRRSRISTIRGTSPGPGRRR